MTRHLLAALLCVALSTCARASDIVINEVLYDPEGSDTGLEFIELMNCGHATVPLTGWTLETGNGANPDDWTVEWIGGPFDELPPGGILVVGERDVAPPPDHVTALDLQNGPDGCRVTDGTAVVDVVGWGEPLFVEYSEGTPAADVASGFALARLPDCMDVDDNSLDFAARPPTPGSRNSVLRDVSVSVRHAERAVFPEGEELPVSAVVRNEGAEDLPAGSITLSLTSGDVLLAGQSHGAALDPRDSTEVVIVWPDPASGYHRLKLSAGIAGDGDPSNNVAATSVTVGGAAGLLRLNELMHSPGDSATEWVELVSMVAETLDVTGWCLGDDEDAHPLNAGASSAGLPSHPAQPTGSAASGDLRGGHGRHLVSPGAFLVVARDPELVNAWGAPVISTDGWEALSTDDVVMVLDEFGTPVESVAYERGWGGGRDVSLERVRPDLDGGDPASWGSCVAPEGSTPGRANSILIGHLPSDGTLTVSPNPFSPDADGENDRAVVSFELPTATALARLAVYDIRGRLRGRLLDHKEVAARHELVWDGTLDGDELPSGLYLLFLEAIDARAGVLTRAKTVVGIVR